MEEFTNPILLSQASSHDPEKNAKRTADDARFNNDFSVLDKAMITLKLTTSQQAYLEWSFRFMLPLLIISFPVFVNTFLIPHEHSLAKGLLGFGSLGFLLFSFTKQKHRISHIAGYENSFYLGFFIMGVTHNYTNFYAYLNQGKFIG